MGKHNYLHNKPSNLLFYIVLDSFVEAVHLIDEHQRGARRLADTRLLGALDGVADVAHAPQHGADGDEFGLEGLRHEPRQRGFSDPRRPPQDAAVRLPGLEGHAQRLAGPEQVRLADHVGQGLRAQPLC